MSRFTGNIASLTVLGIILSVVSGCSNYSAQQKQRQYVNQDADYARQVINLGPGINEACTSAGGIPSLTQQLDGAKTPVCQFANGKRCDVDAIQYGSCL
ncbi:DUF333 domain-containing protein [Moellerella wisconsensis]|uniref:DUF333 domain-containing protein n=2 Tax=Moellerella wisconsensis TaxID=158849 RepID=A0ACD3Y3M0_9GAMM|nr:DUF333 domain-containing protein [Moellerella wisconsensis]KLN96751.1 hypothetical protein VK86_08755 [Moellerella wisconsensis]UNH22912.1 DUF333 domain-containing protein [Moellerella wisconsensis]UNH26050.1 DUF333 domain-containing protein [Moellerella wisconsensis]UNH29466.1 DUF333 domain-containing protein [Moellerella wisconsensis]UNH37605.1 DUF333 domain-containing protein [Moellerella wisconsensis]